MKKNVRLAALDNAPNAHKSLTRQHVHPTEHRPPDSVGQGGSSFTEPKGHRKRLDPPRMKTPALELVEAGGSLTAADQA